jgi:protein SCO1/2
MKKVFRIMTGICCFLMVLSCGQPPAWNGTDVSGVFPDLEFELTDSNGQTINASAFHGKTTLLFFGFTNCPGICPATLGQISVALTELGESADQVQVLLVSVDPDRDTPEAMKAYTARFGPWLHGLTGEEADLKAMNNSFMVDFMAQKADEKGNYDVVHSSRVFAFDSLGRCRLLLSDTSETSAVVSDLNRLIQEIS